MVSFRLDKACFTSSTEQCKSWVTLILFVLSDMLYERKISPIPIHKSHPITKQEIPKWTPVLDYGGVVNNVDLGTYYEIL